MNIHITSILTHIFVPFLTDSQKLHFPNIHFNQQPHSWFPCSKWSCYHSPLSGILTVPIRPHKLVTLLIAHSITYKHTNVLTLSLPPCTYLLPSHYIFPIPSTVYILLLLLEMPHPQFSNTQRSQCLINFISFFTIVSPTLLFYTSIHMHNFHLPQYDIHCVPNYHYHIHSDLVLSLSFTLPNFISSDFIPSSTIIHTVPTATTITQTLALHHHTIPLSLNTLSHFCIKYIAQIIHNFIHGANPLQFFSFLFSPFFLFSPAPIPQLSQYEDITWMQI